MSDVTAGTMRISTCQRCGKKPHSQDTIYGKGKRAFIYSGKALNRRGGWKCTTCGNEKE